jgi:endonuclease YncB( thermonuclease family)
MRLLQRRSASLCAAIAVGIAVVAMGICTSCFAAEPAQPASQQAEDTPHLAAIVPTGASVASAQGAHTGKQGKGQPPMSYASALKKNANHPQQQQQQQQQPHQQQFVQRSVQGAGAMPMPPQGSLGSAAAVGPNAHVAPAAGFPSPYVTQPLPRDPAHRPRDTFRGVVTRCADGDTCDVLPDDAAHRSAEPHGRVRVRFFAVDAPESKQEFGPQAGDSLRTLVLNARVVVEVMDVDQYGRTVARVVREADGLDVNLEQVGRGCAWLYTQYAKKHAPAYRDAYFAAEAAARAARRGLWAAPNPQNPREWRIQHPRDD